MSLCLFFQLQTEMFSTTTLLTSGNVSGLDMLNFTTSSLDTAVSSAPPLNLTPAYGSWNISDYNTTGDNVNHQNELLTRIQNAMFMFQYITLPSFLVVGLFGNIMTIITMASKQFRHLTSRYILIALALSDTALLLAQPFNKLWVIKLFGSDVRAAFSDTGCKIFFHLFRTSKMTSSWLVVLLCFERFIAVVFPLKAKLIIKKKTIFPAIILDYLLIGSYNGAWTFSSGVVNGFCKPDLPSEEHRIFVIIGCTVYSFIPSAILLVFTPQIIIRINRQIKVRRTLTSSKRHVTSSRKEDEMIRASVMVVGVMIAYIILVLPITIVHVHAAIVRVSAFDVNSLEFFVFREVAQVLEQINYSINFFFYVLCSSTFRRRVIELLGFSCCFGIPLLQRRSTGAFSSDKMSASFRKNDSDPERSMTGASKMSASVKRTQSDITASANETSVMSSASVKSANSDRASPDGASNQSYNISAERT